MTTLTGLLLFRIFFLWDRNPLIWRLLLIGGIATYAISLPFLAKLAKPFSRKYQYSRDISIADDS